MSQKYLIDACILARLGYYDFWVTFNFCSSLKVDKISLGMKEKIALTTGLSRLERILVDEAFSNLDNLIRFIQSFRGSLPRKLTLT